MILIPSKYAPIHPAPFADATAAGAAPRTPAEKSRPAAKAPVPANNSAPAQTVPAPPAAVPAQPAPPEPAKPLLGEPDAHSVTTLLKDKFGDRFDILETLAIGGMATLVKLHHRLLGGLFVAKVLHATLVRDPAMREAFRTEARHVAQIAGHPAAVPIFEFLEGDSFACMLMPFIDGEDLDQLIARAGRFPREEAIILLAQIASVLMYAESLGILHCDLAPGNIRLDPFGQYRLFDFGLSRAISDKTTPILAGTPAYNSPERIRGAVPDIRGDLYALGLILIEVLSGRPALEAPSLGQLAQKHLSGDLRIPHEVEKDRPLAVLIRRLVALKPEERIASARELAQVLTTFGYDLPSFARAYGAHPEAPAAHADQPVDAPVHPLIDPPRSRRHRLDGTGNPA